MAQIWTLASSPGQPPIRWLEESSSAPSFRRLLAAYFKRSRPEGDLCGRDPPLTSPLGSMLLTAGDVGSRPLRQKGFEAFITPVRPGEVGLPGALRSVELCLLNRVTQAGLAGGIPGSGVKKEPSCSELWGQGWLCACSRKAGACRVSSQESLLCYQGCVYILFVNSALGLQLISLCYSICIRFYGFCLYGCVWVKSKGNLIIYMKCRYTDHVVA